MEPQTLLFTTLINSIGYNYWPVKHIKAIRTPIIGQLALTTLDWGMLKLVVKRGLCYQEPFPEGMLDFFKYRLNTPKKRKAFLHLAKCLDNSQLLEISDDLKQLKISFIIVRGETDQYLPSDISIHISKEIPFGELIDISTTGRFIHEDKPEQLSQALHSFFHKHSHGDQSERTK